MILSKLGPLRTSWKYVKMPTLYYVAKFRENWKFWSAVYSYDLENLSVKTKIEYFSLHLFLGRMDTPPVTSEEANQPPEGPLPASTTKSFASLRAAGKNSRSSSPTKLIETTVKSANFSGQSCSLLFKLFSPQFSTSITYLRIWVVVSSFTRIRFLE